MCLHFDSELYSGRVLSTIAERADDALGLAHLPDVSHIEKKNPLMHGKHIGSLTCKWGMRLAPLRKIHPVISAKKISGKSSGGTCVGQKG